MSKYRTKKNDPPCCLKLKLFPWPSDKSKQNPVLCSEPNRTTSFSTTQTGTNVGHLPWVFGELSTTDPIFSKKAATNIGVSEQLANIATTAKSINKTTGITRPRKLGVTLSTGIVNRQRCKRLADGGMGKLNLKRTNRAAPCPGKTTVELTAFAERLCGDISSLLAEQLRKMAVTEGMVCKSIREVPEIRYTEEEIEALRGVIELQTEACHLLERTFRMTQSVLDCDQADQGQFTRELDAAPAKLATLRERIQQNRNLIAEYEAYKAAFGNDNPSHIKDDATSKK